MITARNIGKKRALEELARVRADFVLRLSCTTLRRAKRHGR
jgi:hypothetical protein